MALWITNSLLRTKSFQIHSNLPPFLSLPTTTIRTIFFGKSIDPSNTPATDKPSSTSSSSLKPATTPTPKPKHHQKSKMVRLTKEASSCIKNMGNKVMALAPFKKVKEYSPLRNHIVVDMIDPRFLFQSVFQSLKSSPPIIFTGEARRLEERLGEAAMGNAFLLQGGDCDEFNANNNNPDTFRVILQMSTVLMFGGQMPVIKVGNQFAKPRSDTYEEKDGMKLDNLNGDAFALESSTLHQQKWIKAYYQSAYTLNLLRAFAMGGDAAMQRVTQWNLDFMKNSEHGDRYRELASQVDEALGFMSAAYPTVDHPPMTITDFWTSHECRHLPYEQSLTRKDSTSGLNYDCSAHFLWVGERTRQLDGAHVEFLIRIANPLGIKVSEKMDPNELVKLIDILNPKNKPGRITIITRMGAENIKVKLPNIVSEVQRVGQIVTWVIDPDPMPRNTIKAPSSLKNHPFDAIRAEVKAFFDVHEQEGSYPGGVHLEMTGLNDGGSRTVPFDHTHCDPRLNASQSLELAFIIADRLRKRRIATRSTKL